MTANLAATHVDLYKRLELNVPDAFEELRRLEAIYGRRALDHALIAIQETMTVFHKRMVNRTEGGSTPSGRRSA